MAEAKEAAEVATEVDQEEDQEMEKLKAIMDTEVEMVTDTTVITATTAHLPSSCLSLSPSSPHSTCGTLKPTRPSSTS